MGGAQQGLQALVFFGQLDVASLVGNHVRVGDERPDFLKSGIEAVKSL